MKDNSGFESRGWKTFSDRSRTNNMLSSHFSKFNLPALLMLALLMAAWYFGAHSYNKPFTFPFLETVLGEIAYACTDIAVLRALAITLRRVVIGTLYALLAGLPIGMAMGFSKVVMKTLSPFVNAIRQIPTTAWVPLAIIWFGLGDGPTIFVLALHGVFVIILNTAAGVMDINPEYYNAVRSMGAGPWQIIRDVIFPGSLPGVITGVRLALGMGWMTVVWAEFIATNTGFGYMIHAAQVDMGTETCIAYMLMSGIVGLLMDRLLLVGESVLLRWKR